MNANFTGVTTSHVPMESRNEWKKHDEVRKREIANAKDDKRTASLIMDAMASEIAELRKPKPMIVELESWEAWLILTKGGMVWATVGGNRGRCWLTKDKEMYIGNIPARLAGEVEYDTEVYFTEEQ